MRRSHATIVVLLSLPACARWTVAEVTVKDPRAVALERPSTDGPRTLVPAGPPVYETIEPGFLVDDRARRDADGVLEMTRDLSTRRLVVVDEHRMIRLPTSALPTRESAVFWAQFPIGAFGRLAVATPWSNLEKVTLRRETIAPLAWLEVSIGGVMGLGGALLAAEGIPSHHASFRTGGWMGAGIAGIGAVLVGFGIAALLTPSSEWTWAPPSD